MLSVNLPHDMQARLESLASETGVSVEAVVAEVLREYLEDLEDGREADRRRAESAAAVSLGEVKAALGLDH